MLKNVKIEYFRGFETYSLDLDKVSTLVGPNGCGKSTILTCIRFACVVLAKSVNEGNPSYDRYFSANGIYSGTGICWNTPIKWEGYLHYLHASDYLSLLYEYYSGFSICLQFEDVDPIQSVVVASDESGNTNLMIASNYIEKNFGREGGKSKNEQEKAEWVQKVVDYTKAVLPRAVFVPPFYNILLEEEYRTNSTIERLLAGGQHNQVARNLIVRLDTEGFERLNELLNELMNCEIIEITPPEEFEETEYLEVWIQDDESTFELANAAAGITALASLFAGMWRYRSIKNVQGGNVIFLLDEPEAHLHSKLQSEIGAYLSQLAHELDVQLIVATHSVDMINLMSQQPNVLLLPIDRFDSTAQPLRSESQILQELSSWCNLSPFTSLSLLRTKKIVFHEGSNDVLVLNKCADLYFGENPELLRKYKDWSFTNLEGVGNAAAKDILKKSLEPIIAAMGGSEKLHIVRILDKDYSRMPRFDVEQSHRSLTVSAEVVWSLHSIESLFLNESCLLAWVEGSIRRYIPTSGNLSKESLNTSVRRAIILADKNEELLENARRQRMVAICPARDNQSIIEADRIAEQEIKAHPEIWQKGKDRGVFILGQIRDQLPISLQNRIRRDVVQMIVNFRGDVNSNDIHLMIPEDVKRVLDYMVSV